MGTTKEKTTRQHFDKAYKGNPAENYEKYFVPVIGKPLAMDLIEIAGIKNGESILDIACGTGAATFLAAENTGKKGKVTGVDINPGMLEVAKSNTPKDITIEWLEAPAEKIPLPDSSFDVVISNLSLQFFADKIAALKEMFRVLKPGGRLALTLPSPNPVFNAADDIFENHLGKEAAGFVRAVFSLHDHEEIQDMINKAGFKDIAVKSDKKTLKLPQPEDFLWQYISGTPLSAFIEKTDDKTYAELEKDIVDKWQPFVKDDNLILEHNTTLVTARK